MLYVDQVTSTLFPFPEHHTCTLSERVTIKADPLSFMYGPEEEKKISRRATGMEESHLILNPLLIINKEDYKLQTN